jgi:O-methyltransferase
LESANFLWSIQRLAGKLGFRIVRSSQAMQDMEPQFLEIYSLCSDFTMTSIERMYALYKAVEHLSLSKIPGEIVECGVWKGGSCMLVAHTLLSLGDTDRNIYLYDTFAGMNEPTERDFSLPDGRSAGRRWRAAQRKDHNRFCYSPLEEVRVNLLSTGYPEDRMIFVEGEVEKTVPGVAASDIALLRLDTDWYESTRHELVHLFPRLVGGGVLIIDDYGYWAGSKKAVDEYFREHGFHMLLSRIDPNGRMGVKRDGPGSGRPGGDSRDRM